jgi:DNA-binding SARP family transcriptional activator
MGKINLDRLVPILTKQGKSDEVLVLVREIIELQAKLDNLDNQTFYFKKAKLSNFNRLESLKKEYTKVADLINGQNVDFFLEKINYYETNSKQIYSKKIVNTIDQSALGAFKSNIGYLQNLIYIKGKYGTLKPLEELLQDEETLIEIFS